MKKSLLSAAMLAVLMTGCASQNTAPVQPTTNNDSSAQLPAWVMSRRQRTATRRLTA